MIYRQIVGGVSVEYEGTPEEIKAMLDTECNHTGAYDHVALNTGNDVETVCLRCEKDRSKTGNEITYRTTEEGYLQSVHGDNVFTLVPLCINCKRSLESGNRGSYCEKCQ